MPDARGTDDGGWPREVVHIVGMHRTGTSAVSRLLGALGLAHGAAEGLLPPAPDNPYGFWEQVVVKQVNDQLLGRHGGTWDDPPLLLPGWHDDPGLDDLRTDARRVLGDLREQAAPAGLVVKDPRLALTLPFWLDVEPADGLVLTIRHPGAVATSLARRNGFPASRSVALWLTYTMQALAAASFDAVVVAEELARDPAAVARTLVGALHLPVDDVRAAVADAIVPSALHGDALPLDDVPGGAAAQLLYETIRDRGAGPAVTEIARAVCQGGPGGEVADALARSRARSDQLTEQVRAHERHVEEVTRLLTDTREKLRRADQSAVVRRLEADRDRWQRQAQQSARELQRVRGRRAVRTALRAAHLTRPAFRAWRRARSAIESSSAGRRAAETTSTDTGPFPARPAPAGPALADAVRRLEQAPGVTVLIPVHDALEHARASIEAACQGLPEWADIVVIDDASPDPAVRAALERIARQHDRVTLLVNDDNLGYTRTVNRGIAHARGRDVVLLNSDAVVPPGWLPRLRTAAHLFDDVATVTPLSDNAGAFAAPEVGVANDLGGPGGCARITHALAGRGDVAYPTTPTGNGFCMYVRRDALDQVGQLDADAFPRGYGEENDFCMRMGAAGWTHLVEPTVLVHHVRSASFGDQRDALAQQGRRTLDARHPTYTSLVRDWVPGPAMQQARLAVARARDTADDARPTVLYVVHAGSGGTPATTEDLVRGVAAWSDGLVLTSDSRTLRLQRLVDGEPRLLESHTLSAPLRFAEVTNDEYLAAVAGIIVRYGVGRVHVRHLVRHTFDTVRVAKAMGLATVLSLHDFYYVCPTIHLMDEHGTFCGGVCTAGDGDCPVPMSWIGDDVPKLKHAGVYDWRQLTGRLLDDVDHVVTTSRSSRDTYARAFPDLGSRIEVIEHGRDIPRRSGLAMQPSPKGRVRVLFPGNLDHHKGGDLIRDLRRLDRTGRLEIHFAGNVKPQYADVPHVHHGSYDRDRFDELVASIRPTFVGILSICAETYCHTLTEAWGAGVPVIGSELGAIGERIRRHGGGVVVAVDDPQRVLDEILRVADDHAEYTRLRTEAERVRIRPVAEMARAFQDAYARPRSTPNGHDRADLELDLFVRGLPPPHPGSVYVRTIARAEHPAVKDLSATVQDPGPFLSSSLHRHGDVALVQRDAIEPELADQVLRTLDVVGEPLVVDIDDHLLDPSLHPDAYWTPERSASLRDLLRAASLVTVSTPAMADLVADLAHEVRLEPNHLHDDWWALDDPQPPRPPRADGMFVVGYAGTATHGPDLALLGEALDRLPADLRSRVRVEVVGGERDTRPWYERITVPAASRPYPHFAGWLRHTAQQWDVAVAPLADGGLNRWKSDLKFLEYSAVGLPSVVAAGPAYATVPDEVVLRAPADPEAWAEQLAVLLTDAALRQELRERAGAWVRAERRMSSHVADWREALARVAR